MADRIDVLDHGYVRLVNSMGTDLDPVNDAKVSFDKESLTFEEREGRLLAFLARENHTSVFRHSVVKFEVYAPLMVARQWWKYAVASSHVEDQLGWNESSRRYITEEPTFYVPAPNEWRTAPENKKQGSGEPLPSFTAEDWKTIEVNIDKGTWIGPDVSEFDYGNQWTKELLTYIGQGLHLYDTAMASNIAPEMARLFLPAYGMYVRWRWTASLGALMHFLFQRLEHDAQKEIYDFAVATKDLTANVFPKCMEVIS